MTTPKDFALALLSGLGLTESQNNIDAIVSAEAAEGGFMSNTANFNPLNTTQKATGSQLASGFSSSGPQIQSYPDWPTGLQATIATLKNGLYNDILASLAASADPQTTLNVWAANPHYGWVPPIPKVNTAYGSYTFPTSAKMGSFPIGSATSSGMTTPIVKLGLLGGILYALYRALPIILK